MDNSSIGEMVRKAENDYINGNTQISKYVTFNMHDTLERIDAYSNSKHITSEVDSLGREKPFFNIGVAATNVCYRATDIDRSNIKIRATRRKGWVDSFLATVLLRDWMRRERFGSFLNEWGRTLAKYGSAVIKFVENSSGLHISVVGWNLLIVDAVDFDANIKIEIIELTQAQLYDRIKTNGYDRTQVKALCDALTERTTIDRQRKDSKSDYIKIYEVHGKLAQANLVKNPDDITEADKDTYVQQMHVISFVGKKNGRNTEYQDFTLYAGKEKKDPYMITHLIREEGRTLAIGTVEHLFEAQWMTNHSMKTIKDTLDLASRLIFQTSDPAFTNRNVLSEMETGDILTHLPNQALTKVDTSKTDIVGMQNYALQWKSLGNEIAGISEAMLGAMPKSGTAWRQTEAVLQESYSLFELMTENKGLHIEDMLRDRIIPFLKKKYLSNADEISAILEDNEIKRIDSVYIKNQAIKRTKMKIVDRLLNDQEPVTPEEQNAMIAEASQGIQDELNTLGAQRFFKPNEVDWGKQLENLEWDVEVDITGEAFNVQEAMTTLTTALKMVLTPGFEQNEKAKAIVGRALELTGAMSPVEYNAIPSPAPVQQDPNLQPVA